MFGGEVFVLQRLLASSLLISDDNLGCIVHQFFVRLNIFWMLGPDLSVVLDPCSSSVLGCQASYYKFAKLGMKYCVCQ